jgi:predicted PurR-regulated permease PerM
MKLREKTDDDFALAKKRSKETIGIITNFLYGLFVTTLMLAVMLYIVFMIIGLKYALFFAFLVALLTLLPYIGSPLGMAIVFIFASISHDGLMVPLLALAGIIISNAIKGNVIKPIVIGNKINLNAFMIFLSVITGGLIWGVSGMILFMPFAGIAKVLLEYNESTRPLTALFTILPKNALKPSVHSKTEEDQG